MLLPFNSLRVDIATVFPGSITSIGKSSDPEARKYIMIDQELEREDCNVGLLRSLAVIVVRTGESVWLYKL